MTQLTTILLGLTLATVTVCSLAEGRAEITEGTPSVVEGLGADASPEMQAERDEFAAKWEADARAAGLDPDKEEAKSEPESGGSK
jgi:hypothetical protein